jgi:hypothetical protein
MVSFANELQRTSGSTGAGDRAGGAGPAAPDPDDHGGDGGRPRSRCCSRPGAGAASRFSIGLVIVSGMSIGTLFTLFVLPAVYTVLAKDHRAAAASPRNAEIAAVSGGRALPRAAE